MSIFKMLYFMHKRIEFFKKNKHANTDKVLNIKTIHLT